MANWTTITQNDLLANCRQEFVLTAISQSIGSGNNPATEVIADAIAEIRARISAGNELDQDATKIPNSLKRLAVRICIRELKKRIPYELTEDEREDQRRDDRRLKEIEDNQTRFEQPDTPDGDAEMQAESAVDVVTNKLMGSPYSLDRFQLNGLL